MSLKHLPWHPATHFVFLLSICLHFILSELLVIYAGFFQFDLWDQLSFCSILLSTPGRLTFSRWINGSLCPLPFSWFQPMEYAGDQKMEAEGVGGIYISFPTMDWLLLSTQDQAPGRQPSHPSPVVTAGLSDQEAVMVLLLVPEHFTIPWWVGETLPMF